MRIVRAWNGQPFPLQAVRLRLPDDRVLEDAFIWPRFMQEELRIDPDDTWQWLLKLPTWPADRAIPFRPAGDDPHWITGAHPALRYRGHELRRAKIWCQSDYADGLRRYGYTGWQHRISFATHDVGCVPPILRTAVNLNAWLVSARLASSNDRHNHWIATRYDDGAHSIGFHSDKDRDFAPGSYFVVLKLGAPREFAFRMVGEKEPFYCRTLEAGTAVFVRCKAPGAANSIVQHGVPETSSAVGASGSIVSRCITTVVPWERVRREVERRTKTGYQLEET